jgi:hypothetical protein
MRGIFRYVQSLLKDFPEVGAFNQTV